MLIVCTIKILLIIKRCKSCTCSFIVNNPNQLIKYKCRFIASCDFLKVEDIKFFCPSITKFYFTWAISSEKNIDHRAFIPDNA